MSSFPYFSGPKMRLYRKTVFEPLSWARPCDSSCPVGQCHLLPQVLSLQTALFPGGFVCDGHFTDRRQELPASLPHGSRGYHILVNEQLVFCRFYFWSFNSCINLVTYLLLLSPNYRAGKQMGFKSQFLSHSQQVAEPGLKYKLRTP